MVAPRARMRPAEREGAKRWQCGNAGPPSPQHGDGSSPTRGRPGHRNGPQRGRGLPGLAFNNPYLQRVYCGLDVLALARDFVSTLLGVIN